MKKEYNIVKKLGFVFLLVVFTTLNAFAANYSLKGIDVKSNINHDYNIILKLAGNAQIKKIINSKNNISLILNSTIPSDTMEIIYDNNSVINNVIVQKKNLDNTLITIEGKNIADANIFVKNLSNGTLSSLKNNSSFSVFNNKIFLFSFILIFLFLMNILFRQKKGKQNKISKSLNNSVKRALNNYTSVPDDFIINRYMENEKIKKAG